MDVRTCHWYAADLRMTRIHNLTESLGTGRSCVESEGHGGHVTRAVEMYALLQVHALEICGNLAAIYLLSQPYPLSLSLPRPRPLFHTRLTSLLSGYFVPFRCPARSNGYGYKQRRLTRERSVHDKLAHERRTRRLGRNGKREAVKAFIWLVGASLCFLGVRANDWPPCAVSALHVGVKDRRSAGTFFAVIHCDSVEIGSENTNNK